MQNIIGPTIMMTSAKWGQSEVMIKPFSVEIDCQLTNILHFLM